MKKTDLRQFHLVLLLIWTILFMSQFLFFGAVYFNKPELFEATTDPSLLGDVPVLVGFFAVLALVDLAIAGFVRRKGISEAIANKAPKTLQTSLVIGCALCEAISILGMLLALAFDYPYFYLWFILGAIGIIKQFPRRSVTEQVF
jgi:F0F1-type ATP synthase membrane subunit c/vacuolar-type H+-ATPase subunit K